MLLCRIRCRHRGSFYVDAQGYTGIQRFRVQRRKGFYHQSRTR